MTTRTPVKYCASDQSGPVDFDEFDEALDSEVGEGHRSGYHV
jgi:hypothetical protein